MPCVWLVSTVVIADTTTYGALPTIATATAERAAGHPAAHL